MSGHSTPFMAVRTLAALGAVTALLLAGCNAPPTAQPSLPPSLLPSRLLRTTTPSPPSTPTQSPSSTNEVFTWDQALTLVALGTYIDSISIETATPWPTAAPPPPDGFEYFRIAPTSLGENFFAYDPSRWRLVTRPETYDFAIEGEAGLVHRTIPNCELYELFGRDAPFDFEYESWDISPELRIGIAYFRDQGGVVRLVTFPGAILHLSVPPDRWQECVLEAKSVVQTYRFVPSASP